MDVGVTGHQQREGIKWSWVEAAVHRELKKLGAVHKALSSLAAGSDQIFAQAAIRLQIPLVAVVPMEGYERFFDGAAARAVYFSLLSQCEVTELRWDGDPERGFFEAGRFIVDHCDLLFAIWDGEGSEGLGGTGDLVGYAKRTQRPIVHINPLTELVHRI